MSGVFSVLFWLLTHPDRSAISTRSSRGWCCTACFAITLLEIIHQAHVSPGYGKLRTADDKAGQGAIIIVIPVNNLTHIQGSLDQLGPLFLGPKSRSCIIVFVMNCRDFKITSYGSNHNLLSTLSRIIEPLSLLQFLCDSLENVICIGSVTLSNHKRISFPLVCSALHKALFSTDHLACSPFSTFRTARMTLEAPRRMIRRAAHKPSPVLLPVMMIVWP